jgi:hypothetical protein
MCQGRHPDKVAFEQILKVMSEGQAMQLSGKSMPDQEKSKS